MRKVYFEQVLPSSESKSYCMISHAGVVMVYGCGSVVKLLYSALELNLLIILPHFCRGKGIQYSCCNLYLIVQSSTSLLSVMVL